MACPINEVPARLEPSRVTWGRAQCRSLTTVADVALSLEDTYFDLNGVDTTLADNVFTEKRYYVWYNGGTGSDPAIAGKTGIEVTYVSGDLASVIATKTQLAIDALSDFKAEVSIDEVVIFNKKIGSITAELDSGSTGFAFTVGSIGFGGDLGKTSGGISFNMETSTVEIKADQTGDLLLDDVFSGAALNIDMSLLEMSAANWALIVGQGVGSNFTPSGGTQVTGMGSAKVFKNATSFAGQLVLHPLSVEDTDKSRNLSFWLSLPLPSSINFSGTDVQVMEVQFKAYNDKTKNPLVDMFVFGDQSQEGFDI